MLTAAMMVVGTAAAGCSSADVVMDGAETTGRVSSPVIKGKNSDKSQDAVVLLMRFDPETGEFGSCTATLLSPRLVLTARHCVADTDVSAACDVDGNPLAQGEIRGNHKANTFYVFTGPNRPDFGSRDVKPAGQGLKIIDDGAKNLCNHDVALVVLKEPVANAVIAPVRLEGPIQPGEVITAVGWGVTDKTSSPDVRQQRTGVRVTGVGPLEENRTAVPPNEFEVGESICSGDSGGPAFAASGAVIGVVSRGGNSRRPSGNDPAAACIGGENIYTKVEPFKDLLLKAYELVEAEPWYENGEDPRLLKPGSACSDGTECRSSLCLPDPSASGETTCAQNCAAAECPEGTVCTTEGEAQICRAPAPPPAAATTTTTTTGCSIGAAATTGAISSGMIAFGLGAFGFVLLRRRLPRKNDES